ncbi:hypothetical protein A2239_04390 [Candidatus Uhrbacteria bacterium RIFOXYA2_FULL_40_9]|nr:MAG: hypothetical protein UT94_C0002G0030 [Candidatus Uhrbacteria bacterium GW2011_GWF2_40_263]OGL92988.1 MAG: hypothetical protein A2239_04390 [Candidatus Uhrbacteria bacterium RIFOXYA2_FULL_40_9]OGL97386.1 MAG: hypothetical protein A2332_04675 [Candidatus Uhrbacteria bacterium RIFOXYB2_FULL_41_18]HBK35025.1 hypothetical protein [Candidatus Uhrbacteria bacterium]HCB56178.1 hypothetical protein [Candidatus Uhrbacteria bacterium]
MKTLSPNDFGSFTADEINKIKIDEVVQSIKGELKQSLVHARLEALGVDVELTTSKTGYGGKRLWFKCPICKCRVGVLFHHPLNQLIGCRICLSIRYRKQRYKGMIESEI